MFKKKNRNRISATITLASLSFVLFSYLFFPKNIEAQVSNYNSFIEDKDGIFGITPLMNASLNEDLQTVDFLSGSKSNSINQKNIGGASALSIASRVGNLEIAKKLVENGANVDNSDNEGWTPLMRASLAKNSDLISFLLERGADPRKTNKMGETVIIQSAYSGCKACLEVLFNQYNFIKKFNLDLLKNQVIDAIKIANNKNDQENIIFLKAILAKINKSKLNDATEEDKKNIKSEESFNNKKIIYKLSSKANSTENLILNKPKPEKSGFYQIIYKFLGYLLQRDGTKILYSEKYNKISNNKIDEKTK